MDWSSSYPAYATPEEETKEVSTEMAKTVRPLKQDVEVADIGCGFGGLLVALAPRLPNTLLLGVFPRHGS